MICRLSDHIVKRPRAEIRTRAGRSTGRDTTPRPPHLLPAILLSLLKVNLDQLYGYYFWAISFFIFQLQKTLHKVVYLQFVLLGSGFTFKKQLNSDPHREKQLDPDTQQLNANPQAWFYSPRWGGGEEQEVVQRGHVMIWIPHFSFMIRMRSLAASFWVHNKILKFKSTWPIGFYFIIINVPYRTRLCRDWIQGKRYLRIRIDDMGPFTSRAIIATVPYYHEAHTIFIRK